MIDSDLWPRLGTTTRRALRRSKKAWGHPYEYRPRGNLCARLAQETGRTKGEIYRELLELHRKLKQPIG